VLLGLPISARANGPRHGHGGALHIVIRACLARGGLVVWRADPPPGRILVFGGGGGKRGRTDPRGTMRARPDWDLGQVFPGGQGFGSGTTMAPQPGAPNPNRGGGGGVQDDDATCVAPVTPVIMFPRVDLQAWLPVTGLLGFHPMTVGGSTGPGLARYRVPVLAAVRPHGPGRTADPPIC